MKTMEELNALKSEFEAVSKILEGLSEEELTEVCGGVRPSWPWWTETFKVVFANEKSAKSAKMMQDAPSAKMIQDAPSAKMMQDAPSAWIPG